MGQGAIVILACVESPLESIPTSYQQLMGSKSASVSS